jgi:cupin superfamily acireductone dioxygenase involved in methionine salvage
LVKRFKKYKNYLKNLNSENKIQSLNCNLFKFSNKLIKKNEIFNLNKMNKLKNQRKFQTSFQETVGLTDEQLEYQQLAKEFTDKHFHNDNVSKVSSNNFEVT